MSQLPSFYGKGSVDLRGPAGPQGPIGPQGPAGPKGEPGRPGKDATGAEAGEFQRLNDDVALLTSRVRDEITQRITDDEAFAGRLQSVEASYVRQTDVELALEARVTQEATARANSIEAEAIKREEAVATLRKDSALTVTAAIAEEQRARADDVAAVASRVGTIEADYSRRGEVDQRVNAKVSEESQARADADNALARRVSTLEADYSPGGDGVDSVARAMIRDEMQVRADGDSAEASARQSLAATLRGETSASVANEAKARSDAVGAEASARQALAATLRGETDQKVSAAVTTEQQARTAALSAIASRTSLVEAGVTGTPTALSPNDRFSSWPITQSLPTFWVWWRQGGELYRIQDPGLGGATAIDVNAYGGSEHGIAQWAEGGNGLAVTAGYWMMEADVELLDGSWLGAGVTIHGVHSLDFAREPDSLGRVDAFLKGRRFFSKLVNVTSPLSNWHLMWNWTGFRDLYGKIVRTRRCTLRPATPEEVLSQKNKADLVSAVARVAAEEKSRADADGALAGRLSAVEASYVTAGAVDAKVAAKVSEETRARADADGALAGRADYLQAQLNGTYDSGLNGRIYNESLARANQDGALASRIDTVEATANGAKSSVETVQRAVAGVDGRQEIYWAVTGTTPDGKVAISLRKKDGSAGEFLVDTNMRVTGNLIVDGSVNWKQIAVQDLGRIGSASWGGSISPPAGTRQQIPFGLALGTIKPSGYFTAVATIVVNTNAGQRYTTNLNGKPHYVDYVDDGGVTVGFGDGQGNGYNIVPGTSTFAVRSPADFAANVTASIFNNNMDTGVVNDGDYYYTRMSATYTVTVITLQLRWSAI